MTFTYNGVTHGVDQAALDAETAARVAADLLKQDAATAATDGELSSAVSSLAGGISENTSAIGVEVTRAEGAEGALNTRLGSVESRHRVLGEFSTLTSGMAVFAGELVVNANVLNERLADGALEASFDQTLWKPVGGGGGGLTVAAEVSADAALAVGKLTPVNATSGARTMTLPTGASGGTLIAAQKSDASTNTVVLAGSIRGSAGTLTVKGNRYETQILVADSAGSWWPYSDHKTWASIDAEIAALSSGGGATPQFQIGRTTPAATAGGLQRSMIAGKLPIAARNAMGSSGSNGTDAKEYSVQAYKALFDGVGFDAAFDNWITTASPITVTGAIVLPDGGIYQLQSGGKPRLTIESGFDGRMQCGGAVKAGDIFLLRLFVQAMDAAGNVIAGGKWPQHLTTAMASLGETVVSGAGASDLTTASAGSQPAAASAASYRPRGFWVTPLSTAKVRVPAVTGDSIAYGIGDDQTLINGPGFFARGLNGTCPYLNVAVSGTVIGEILTSGFRQRMRELESATSIYEQSGANSLISGSLASIQGLKITVWRALALYGVRIRTITLFPRDAIGAPQIAVRAAFNQWIRDGAPLDSVTFAPAAVGASGGNIVRFGGVGHLLHGYDDIAAATETALDSGLYKPGYSADGTHPTPTGAAAAAAAMNVGALV